MKSFWKEWLKSNEVERLELLKELPCFDGEMFAEGMSATLLNSYLEDLEYVILKREFGRNIKNKLIK